MFFAKTTSRICEYKIFFIAVYLLSSFFFSSCWIFWQGQIFISLNFDNLIREKCCTVCHKISKQTHELKTFIKINRPKKKQKKKKRERERVLNCFVVSNLVRDNKKTRSNTGVVGMVLYQNTLQIKRTTHLRKFKGEWDLHIKKFLLTIRKTENFGIHFEERKLGELYTHRTYWSCCKNVRLFGVLVVPRLFMITISEISAKLHTQTTTTLLTPLCCSLIQTHAHFIE